LLPALGVDPKRGFGPVGWPGNGRLVTPLGVVDKPFEQVRDVMWANLAGAAGNVIVVGSPQSGKSTALRSLLCSLALTHTPIEVQFFCLDFGGGTLASLAGLPHMSGVADRQSEESCRRVVATCMQLLTDRENLFREQGLDSMDAFRAKYAGSGDPSGFGDVFLVIDNWLTLRQEFEKLEESIIALANRGLGYGIHVVISANRWWDVRTQIRDMLGTRLELRLGDPGDSEIDRRVAANVPADSPGRGITLDKRQCLVALPRLGQQSVTLLGEGSSVADGATESLASGVQALVSAIQAASPLTAPRLGLLPRELPYEELPTDGSALWTPIGVGESSLQPVGLDFMVEPHLIAYADVESGKTNLLRLIVHQLITRNTPDEIRIVMADYRRGLLEYSEAEHVIGYAGSENALGPLVQDTAEALRERLPGPEVTPKQLRNHSWWQGPRLFFIIDDYDLVSAAASNPLIPLVDLLGQARDIHLHVVVTRRSGGAGRTMFDPVLGRLRELASPGLVMSGSRDEGPLAGDVKPGPQPPGRGWLVRRREGNELVQVAIAPPR
jgi:DNA segregation ATPase FtsK/SpoIIIE, S-DNA-T family